MGPQIPRQWRSNRLLVPARSLFSNIHGRCFSRHTAVGGSSDPIWPRPARGLRTPTPVTARVPGTDAGTAATDPPQEWPSAAPARVAGNCRPERLASLSVDRGFGFGGSTVAG